MSVAFALRAHAVDSERIISLAGTPDAGACAVGANEDGANDAGDSRLVIGRNGIGEHPVASIAR
jgi:hypothetical protein